MTRFIEEHRQTYGVGSICRVLSIAPSAYYAYRARQKNPCMRSQKDKELCHEIRRVWNDNFCVYGARKVWHQLKREGLDVARCTVERLMRRMGLKGVIRGKGVRTTRPDPARPCPQDLVQRQFHAPAPNRLVLCIWGRCMRQRTDFAGVATPAKSEGDGSVTGRP